MLLLFFLKKFYKSFFVFFISLVLIFAASDLFVRLPIISSPLVLPRIFILMFPLMAQFAIPLASCLSVQFFLGNLYIEDEIVLIYFFNSAKNVLQRAVLIFSLSLLTFYVPIIFSWAPKSYKKGKILILDLAKKHFSDLQPGKFHNLSKKFTLFFEKQNRIDDVVEFYKILLMYKDKSGNRFIINSKSGLLSNDILFLKDGVMQNVDSKKSYSASFKTTQIDLKQFLDLQNPQFKIKDLKFFTSKELNLIKKENLFAFIEYHKRIAQIIWQFLFPFLSLFLIMLFARRKSNLLLSVFISGVLFLTSYIVLNLVKTLSFLGPAVIMLFYLPIIFIFLFTVFPYMKKI
jgi:lipopolysaccharide export LptBFGC system permease protein LptF